MPTATSTLGWTLANWGAVPETYNISPSCTASTDVFIAYTDIPEAPFWPEVCVTATTDTCWPVPTDQGLFEEHQNNRYMIAYFSPGVSCPSGWKSIGEARHPINGPVTSSGIFQGYPGRFDYDTNNGSNGSDDNNDDPINFGYQDALGALLDSGETAIACCPSSMTVAENGVCYELLPSHTVSTACDGEWATGESTTLVSTSYILNGTTRTGPVVITATDSINPLPITSTTTTFSAGETGDLIAVRLQGAIFLVHRESDIGPTESTGDSDSETEETSGETNAAETRFYTGESGWAQSWRMLGVLGFSTLIGFVLILPA